jgi:hypothetical protein
MLVWLMFDEKHGIITREFKFNCCPEDAKLQCRYYPVLNVTKRGIVKMEKGFF